MKPIVLLFTTARWLPTARLGMALSQAGFEVQALCPRDHPITKTRIVSRTHVYNALSPLPSLQRTLRHCRPELIVPSDDLATIHLYDLHAHEASDSELGRSTCKIIERSLGSPRFFQDIRSRSSLMAIAESKNIGIPATAPISDSKTLHKWIFEKGLPVVLKADGTSSSEGVRLATTARQAERAFHSLHSPLSFIRMAKRAVINKDLRWVHPTFERRRSVISAQEFISGRDATSLVACWQGEVLAGLHFEVLTKQHERGPASALRLISNSEICAAIRKLVRHLGLSGLHGFDFLIESASETPYLIEMNPRATQVGHLALGPGRDLPAALYAALTGSKIQERAAVTSNPTIALFPQEWLRNPTSGYLQTGYHDIPWEEPELVSECLRKTRRWSDWRTLEKLIQGFRDDRVSSL